MNIDSLRFDNSNNCCESLRVLAEMVRSGEARVLRFDIRPEDGVVRVDVLQQGSGVSR